MEQTTTRRRSRRSTEDQLDPIRQYVDDLMRERGGALNADDLPTLIHACTKRFLESALDGVMEFLGSTIIFMYLLQIGEGGQ